MTTKMKFLTIFLFSCFSILSLNAQRKFVHPGITYTQGDLDRMKAMVEARREPFYSTYRALLTSGYSQIGNGNYSPIDTIAEGRFNATIGGDGRRAHDLALLYHITGNRAYANDAVARLNRYKNLHNASSRGTGPLDNGKIYLLIEAAELMRDYDGWLPADQQAFKAALVYPFYSTTKTAESYKSNDDSKNRVSIYWNIYQFDPGRFGNQGLFAARGLMAMGVYLDNDTIYDRAYRYLACQPSRADDHNYKPGPPVRGNKISESAYQFDYNVSWPSTGAEYFSDEALKYYIYENGQCQESSRDQGHTLGGIGNYTALAEIAWNQGDSLYSWLDNRILLGMEYNIRYNLSSVQSYADQPQPWEPTGASKNEADCTLENGVFYQAVSRSKRWESISISPQARGDLGTGGWRTQVLQHYKVRAGLPAEKYKWLQRAYDKMMNDHGLENWGVAPNWYYEWCGWGTLTKMRTDWMAGDAGTWTNGERVSSMPKAPCTIKAVDYDYYSENGEGHTYHNGGKINSTLYRTDGTLEIAQDGADYALTDMLAGEWMNYSVIFPAPAGNTTAGITQKYNIYATYKSTGAGVKLFAAVDNDATMNGKELEPASTWTERCLGTFEVPCGAAVVRIYVKGISNLLKLKDIRIDPVKSEELVVVDLDSIASSVKVYDGSNVDITEANEAVVTAATDGDKNVPIELPHQKFLVYDFGEDGLDIRDITLYNDGVTMDTREQAKAQGSTAGGKYTGAWDRNTASDILRTNGTTYTLSVPVMNDSWVTTDGSNGVYQVGPLGKYRYFCFYNWSAAGRISELEIRSIVTTSSVGEDTEPSAKWDDTDDTDSPTAIHAVAPESSVRVMVNGHTVTVQGASAIDAYSVAGSKQAVSKTEQITLPSGTYLLKIDMNGQVVNRKVMVK